MPAKRGLCLPDELTTLFARLYLDQDVPVQLAFDREQLRNQLFYA
jgi:hypothetical protein